MDFVKLDDLVSSSLNNDRFKTLALLKEMDQGLLRCYEQESSQVLFETVFCCHQRNWSIASILIKILSEDKNEVCRESAIGMLYEYFSILNNEEFFQKLQKADYEKYSSVIIVFEELSFIFQKRMSFDHIFNGIREVNDGNIITGSSFIEKSEDVRLLYLLVTQELFSMIHLLGFSEHRLHEDKGMEFEACSSTCAISLVSSSNICSSLARIICSEPNPDFKREGCNLIQMMSKYVPHAIKMNVESLLPPLTSAARNGDKISKHEEILGSIYNVSLLSHRHSKIRAVALETGLLVLICSLNTLCFESESYHQNTGAPGSLGFSDVIENQVIPSWSQCVFDRVANVRIKLVYVVGKLLSKYTECYGTFVRSDVPNECPPFLIGSIFILLSGLCDNVVDVHKMSMNALQILAESGFNGQGVGGLLLVLYPTLYPFILEKCTDWDVSKRVNALGVLAESMKLILEAKNDERSPIEERCMIDIISQLCECCIDEDDELESFNAICKCCKTFAVKRETVEVALTIACGRLGHGSILISGYSSIEHVAATLIILSRLLEGMSILSMRLSKFLSKDIAITLTNRSVTDCTSSPLVMRALAHVSASFVTVVPDETIITADRNSFVINFLKTCVQLLGCPKEFGVYADIDKALSCLSDKLNVVGEIDMKQYNGYILLSFRFREVFMELTNGIENKADKQTLAALNALLRNSCSNVVCQNLDLVLPALESFFSKSSINDIDYDEKIMLLSTLESILTSSSQNNDGLNQFSSRLINGSIYPNLVWKAGGKSAGARKLALACLFPLLKRVKVIDNIIDVVPILLPVLCSNLDDYDASTRQLSCLCLSLLFQSLPTVLINEDVVRQVYPNLLKLLDDSSDGARCVACKAIVSFMKTSDPAHFKGTPIDFIVEQLMIHLDDSNPLIQEAVLDALFVAHDIDKKIVSKHAHKSRLSHRSPDMCDKLLKM